MAIPPTESGEGDPGQVTRIAEEFIRLQEAGEATDLDEFCARYPEDQRAQVQQECEQLLRIHGVLKQHDPLAAGQTLGTYEILGPIGKGGMGEVYRARDPELDRDIAIKVLQPELACQPERVKRFKREAKAIAALDHPNIVTVYSVEESDGLNFITMQLVQGKTLSELIPKKGFALEKFFDLAIPLADAISSAHEQGITHRDLKPANIMVTADGRVEILDFGLAKLKPQVTAEGPTEIPLSSLTVEGQIVGTVAYMSPEQAEGRDVDHRTDIFSLGIILYEMVTGQRPFKGESRVALMSSIMKDTPTAVRELSPQVPNHLDRIIRRSLEKDPEHRFQTAKDQRNELTGLRREMDSEEIVMPAQPTGRRWVWAAASGALLTGLLSILVLPLLVNSGEAGGPRIVGNPRPLTDLRGYQRRPNLSPDGQTLLYDDNTSGNGDIFRQRAAVGATPTNLTVDYLRNDYQAAFDPTGERIAFRRAGQGIFEMEATGESPRGVVPGNAWDPAWSPDGKRLAYSTVEVRDPYDIGEIGELWVAELDGETPPTLYTRGALDPSWSPNDKWIAYYRQSGPRRDIWTIPADGGEPLPVTDDPHTDWGPFWSPDGKHLFYLSDRDGKADLWAVAIDEDSGVPLGTPQKVYFPTLGLVINASISGSTDDNTWKIACEVESVESQFERVLFDPESGQLADDWEEIEHLGNDRSRNLSLSPDGAWLAFNTHRGIEDVFVMKIDGSEGLNLTRDVHRDRIATWYPIVEPDGGMWLTYFSNRGGPDYQIWAIRSDGSRRKQLTAARGDIIQPRWEPEGERLHTLAGAFDFFNGLLEEPSGPSQMRVRITNNASWSRARSDQLIAQTGNSGGTITVFSRDRRFNQTVEQADGTPYVARWQTGSRWLDDHRLIFWDVDLEKAFLWDVDTEEASEIKGIREPGEFVFSEDGRTLFRLRVISSSDIWLIELDPKSLK